MMYLLGILCLVVATVALPVLRDPPTLPNSIGAALQDSEIHTNIQNVANNSDQAEGKKDNEEVQKDIVKMVSVFIPPPPQLPPFDYSILRKQKADEKQNYEDSEKQKAQNSNKEKEAILIQKSIKIEVPPKPATWPDSEAALQNSEDRENILNVASDDASVVVQKDDEETKNKMNKIDTVIIPPPPPELPPFDYSIFKQQKADQKQKVEYSAKQEADKSEEEKKAVIQEQEKSVQVEVAPNPPTEAASASAHQNSEDRKNILDVVSENASIAVKKHDEEARNKIYKIDTVIVPPPPPELPPFDYSIFKQQKADQKQKVEYSAKQEAHKSKEENKAVIQDQKKSVQVDVLPNPPTVAASASALQNSEDRKNFLDVVSDDAAITVMKDNEESKKDVIKIAPVVFRPPPELLSFDNSILRSQVAEQKQNTENYAKQKIEDSKTEKMVAIEEKPVEVQVGEEPKLTVETKFVEDSKPIEEIKPVDESKPKEELQKEPVKPSEDLPVIIQWTIPSAPFLSKLISNYPTLPSFGLEWPFQGPWISRHPRIIYPKFDIDGLIYTN